MTRKIGEASSSARPATNAIGVMAQTAIGPRSYQGRDSLHAAIIMSAVLATQSKPAMIAFLDLDWRRNYPDESLNTGVSFRKDDSGSNLGE